MTINFKKVFGSLVFAALFLEASCASDPSSDPNFYKRTGFDVGSSSQQGNDNKQEQPQGLKNSNPINSVPTATKVVPDYYYRQPAYSNQGYAPQNFQQPAQQYQPQQYASPQYQQPYVAPYYQQMPAPYYQPSPYLPQAVANSRFYANPYAIPPSNQSMQRYDVDQFYVPPAIYRDNAEPQQALPKTQEQPVVRY